MSEIHAGFDITVFPSAESWRELLIAVECNSEPFVTEKNVTWPCSKGLLATEYNPFSEEHFNPKLPNADEPGMIGYIGITGQPEFVDKVFDYIKKNAIFIKDECYGKRSFI